jgi:uncharacterized membrane protein YqjE
MQHHSTPPADTNVGLIESITNTARNAIGLLVSRIELAALELAEARNHLFRIVLIAMLGAIAAWFAIACWTALIVVLSWQALRWTILLILAAIFSLLAAGALFYVRSLIKDGKLSMQSTLAELRKDRDTLTRS